MILQQWIDTAMRDSVNPACEDCVVAPFGGFCVAHVRNAKVCSKPQKDEV